MFHGFSQLPSFAFVSGKHELPFSNAGDIFLSRSPMVCSTSRMRKSWRSKFFCEALLLAGFKAGPSFLSQPAGLSRFISRVEIRVLRSLILRQMISWIAFWNHLSMYVKCFFALRRLQSRMMSPCFKLTMSYPNKVSILTIRTGRDWEINPARCKSILTQVSTRMVLKLVCSFKTLPLISEASFFSLRTLN